MPSSRQVRMTRTAISPRFATNTFVIGLGTASYPKRVSTSANEPPKELKRVDGSIRFGEVQWFAAIDSTNRYLVEQVHAGAPDGLVAVADMQHAGKGRLGRVWSA